MVEINENLIKNILNKFAVPKEFILFEGDKLLENKGDFQWVTSFYNLKETINNKYPLQKGFKREVKLAVEATDNLTGNDFYLKFFKDNSTYWKEYNFIPFWGGLDPSYRGLRIVDFDYENLPEGHMNVYGTPDWAATGQSVRIYRVYFLIIDTLI